MNPDICLNGFGQAGDMIREKCLPKHPPVMLPLALKYYTISPQLIQEELRSMQAILNKKIVYFLVILKISKSRGNFNEKVL